VSQPEAGSAEAIIRLLGLEPHPEGGFYRRTFEDAEGPDGRAASTAIYYLLGRGMSSHWHRIDAVEVWHYYAGAPMALSLSQDGVSSETHRLGPDLAAGERPQAVVPTGWWQAAVSLGDWTLVGCTVAPGFRFEGFELAPQGWTPQSGGA
jgi:predicted cupin superfamily sugar epimerase